MSEGQFGASATPATSPATSPACVTGAATASTQPSKAGKQKPARRSKSARAQAYKTQSNTWSARVRRQGADIFLSGFTTQKGIEQELNVRVAALAQRGKPYGAGPERTTVAKAMQQHALQHLPMLKGADQEARRINKYLRAAKLDTLEVRMKKSESSQASPPSAAQKGAYCDVWLVGHADSARTYPQGLKEHREKLLARTGKSDSLRKALANTKMADVTYEPVQDLVNQLQSEGFAKATVLQEVALLKRLFNHAHRKWHWVVPAKNPACHLKLAGELVKRERVMSHDEQARLDQALEASMNAMLAPVTAFATETAMRAEEFLSAKWGNVDFEARLLHLKDAKAGARDVPLSPRAIEVLKALGPSDEPNKKIFGITYESLKAGWRRACERAGITDLHIQDLRHTAATRMALKSGNLFLVQKLTGHKTIAMVQRYVNVRAEDVVALMHAPEPTDPADTSAAPAAHAGVPAAALNPEALQAAMHMLQAAAAQLAAKPTPRAAHRSTEASNDASTLGAAA